MSRLQFEHQIAQYDESIRYVDDQQKRIADQAKAAGRKVRWVVTADHGEEFGERGSWGHLLIPFMQSSCMVPLIVSGPGIPKSVQEGEWVGSQDLAPTVAAWAGVEGQLQAEGIRSESVMAGQATPSRPF